MCLSCPPTLHNIFHTRVAWCSLFVLKLPLNTKQPTDQTNLVSQYNLVNEIAMAQSVVVAMGCHKRHHWTCVWFLQTVIWVIVGVAKVKVKMPILARSAGGLLPYITKEGLEPISGTTVLTAMHGRWLDRTPRYFSSRMALPPFSTWLICCQTMCCSGKKSNFLSRWGAECMHDGEGPVLT